MSCGAYTAPGFPKDVSGGKKIKESIMSTIIPQSFVVKLVKLIRTYFQLRSRRQYVLVTNEGFYSYTMLDFCQGYSMNVPAQIIKDDAAWLSFSLTSIGLLRTIESDSNQFKTFFFPQEFDELVGLI